MHTIRVLWPIEIVGMDPAELRELLEAARADGLKAWRHRDGSMAIGEEADMAGMLERGEPTQWAEVDIGETLAAVG
jgi:hypothetical protein